jgi:hypothetical protein
MVMLSRNEELEAIWETAQAFADAFGELFGSGHPPGAIGPLVIPGVVCGAFALELCLKCLLRGEGKSLRGHRPSKLFASLQPETRARAVGHLHGVPSDKQLTERLKTLDAAFTDWRYVYEADALRLDVGLLIAALTAFEEVVWEAHPNWKRPRRRRWPAQK